MLAVPHHTPPDLLDQQLFACAIKRKAAEAAYLNLRIELQSFVPKSPSADHWTQAVRKNPNAWRQAPLPAHLRHWERQKSLIDRLFAGRPQWQEHERIQILAHLWTNMFLFAPALARQYHLAQDNIAPQ